NASRAHAWLLDSAAEKKTIVILIECQCAQGVDRINATRRQKDEIRSMPPSIFKAVRGTEQISVNNIIRIAAIAGVHARLGGCFNEDIGRPHTGQVVDAADIPVHEFHAARAQARKCELAATALKIIEGDDRRGRPVAFERKREVGAEETSPSS